LYNLNRCVVEPMVVNTVSKTTVSALKERFPFEKERGFLQLDMLSTATTINPNKK